MTDTLTLKFEVSIIVTEIFCIMCSSLRKFTNLLLQFATTLLFLRFMDNPQVWMILCVFLSGVPSPTCMKQIL